MQPVCEPTLPGEERTKRAAGGFRPDLSCNAFILGGLDGNGLVGAEAERGDRQVVGWNKIRGGSDEEECGFERSGRAARPGARLFGGGLGTEFPSASRRGGGARRADRPD